MTTSRLVSIARWRPGRRVAIWCLITFVLWTAAVALTLTDARTAAENGRDRLFEAATVVESGDLEAVDIDQLRAEVSTARRDLEIADQLLSSMVLHPLRLVPVVRRQFASARSIANSGSATARDLDLLLEAVVVTRDAVNPSARVAGLEQISERAASLEETLESNDLGPSERLFAPLADARASFETKRTELIEVVAPIADVTAGLSQLLGESRYLLLGANPSEMRLAGGMPLSAGELNVRAGEFDLAEVTPTHALYPVDGVPIVDADIASRWGFLSPSDDYRKLGYSARFAEWTGPQAIAMWEHQFGVDLDGVIQVDPFLMQALLTVLGPVEVEGRMFDSGNITEYLLIGQYEEFSDIDYSIQDERRDQLALVALTVLRELGQRDWDPIALGNVLAQAGRGRHILAYSENPVQQRAWEQLGVAGQLDGDEAGAFVLNTSAAKLDSFMNVEVDVTSSVQSDGRRHVLMNLAVTNRVPIGVSAQAAGLWEVIGLKDDGSYLGRLVVYAPALAENLHFEDDRTLEVFGPDGQVWVMGTRLEVDRGETVRIDVSFDLPADVDYLDIVPSTRYPFQHWRVAGAEYVDTEEFRLFLGS